jgi:iron complex outermembrane receptor protein
MTTEPKTIVERPILLLSLAIAAALAGGSARADTSAEMTDLQEITVTARRREEALIEVPLAVSAFTGAQLERAGAVNLRDLAALTPGLTVNDAGAEFYSTPIIRGLAQLNTQNGAVENNVSVFFNGTYLANAGAINVGMLNLERVEVVKGPVSALYGRNAFAGAINYVTRAPSAELSGDVGVTLGNDARQQVKGTISGPLGSRVRASLSAVYDSFDGTWKDPVNGRRANDFRKKDALASFSVDASDSVEVRANFYYGDDSFGAPAATHLVNNCAGGTQYCGEMPEGTSVEVPAGGPDAQAAGNDRKVKHGDVTLDAGLGSAGSLQFIAGYNDSTALQYDEFNRRRDGLAYTLIPGPGTVNMNMYYGDTVEYEDYSGELRWSSPADRAVRLSAGGFWSDAKIAQETKFGINSNPIPAGQRVGGIAPLWLTPGGVPSANRTAARAGVETLSGFASVEVDFATIWTFSTEGRYTRDDKYLQVLSNSLIPNGPVQPEQSEAFGFGNFRSAIRVRPTSDLTVYLSAANGTKSGGFNSRATVPQDVAYDPETNVTYELGAKTRLYDGRVSLEAAAFLVDWKDIQILGPSSDPNNPGQVVKNFGSARAYGGEARAGFAVTPAVRWEFGVAYSDPKFRAGTYDFQYAAICSRIPSCAPRVTSVNGASGIDLDGLSLPRQSDWQLTTSVDASRELGSNWIGFARLDASYSSKQYYEPAGLSYWGAHPIVNLRVGGERGPLSVWLWGNNLTNDTTPYMAAYNLRVTDFVFENLPYYPDKRTFGLTATYTF